MTLQEQVCAQALLLSGGVIPEQEQILKILCASAVSSLEKRLREGLTPEDCRADFVAASSLYALAALSEVDEVHQMEYVQAGDVTLRRKSANTAANCLRMQAELMISPYLKGRFSFQGV